MNALIINESENNIDNIIEVYANEYHSYVKKSLEGYLNTARVVYECSTKLSDVNDFERFCSTIGMDPKSSTLRKFKVIGKEFDLLIKYLNQIPSNWTTVYEIARLGTDKIEDLLLEQKISSNTTGKELKILLSENIASHSEQEATDNDAIEGEVVQNGTTEEAIFTVNMSRTKLEEQSTIIDLIRLKDGLEALGATLSISEVFQSLIH